ncbi:hypothetical protein SB783_43845, partial [Paraburkholderia sp. SIMBA_009]
LLPFTAVRTFAALLTLLARFGPLLALWLLRAFRLFGMLLRCNDAVVAIVSIHLVAIRGIVFATVVALETFLHLGLSRGDDAIVVFSVLQ